jgi:hypothetical protein
MILLFLGCPTPPSTVTTDTASLPAPWEGLEAVELEAMRALMETPLTDSTNLRQLRTLPSRGLTAMLSGPDILILDPLYHHSPATHCVSASEWPSWEDESRQGTCQEGRVQTRRGKLLSDSPALDVTFDPVALQLVVLTAAGTIQTANADLLSGNPLDLLRLGEPLDLKLRSLPETARIAMHDGMFAVSNGPLLHDDSGTTTLPADITALTWADGVVWALMDTGLWVGGETVAAAGTHMAVGTDAVWIGGVEGIARVARSDRSVSLLSIDGATGPIAADGARVFVATDDGIAVIEDGEETARYIQDAPADLAVGPPHELLSLTDAAVQVFLDETALVGGDPLDVVMTAFIEKPRNNTAGEDCRGSGSTISGYVEQAMINHAVLSDLPLPAVVGITPFFAQRAAECDLVAMLAPLIDTADIGVLYHSPTPDDCSGDCLVDWLAEDAGYVSELGAALTWASGLAAKDDLDDFVDLLQQSGGPDRYLFFGISALPQLNHEADPRSKNAWPLASGERSSAWRIDHADELAEGAAGGWLSIYPGDNIPLFNLGGCPNLLLRECHQLGLGGSSDIDTTDTTALTLMLHRALADRDGVSTFSFHLPDLAVYDYTADCTETDRVWSGEACQAAVLQEWAVDVWQRHVLGGTARMSTPAGLARPE